MIQLLPITEQSLLDRLNKAYGTAASDGYACIEKKEIRATCLYTVEKNCGIILNVSSVEDDIADGLVRAVFASLAERGIHRAAFFEKTDRAMIERLGFVEAGSLSVPSIEAVLAEHKCCAGQDEIQ